MDYALIEDGIVVNVILLNPGNADDFPNAVPMGDIPAGIGDTWDGEHFYREGKQLLAPFESAKEEINDMRAALALLGVKDDGE